MSKYSLIILVLCFCTLIYGLYQYGRMVERQEGIKQNIKAMKLQENLREKYNNITAYDLCIELGGLPDDCKLLVAD